MKLSEADVCKMFDDVYQNLSAESGAGKVKGLFTDEPGFLLLEVCELLPHAPTVRSILPIDSAFASKLNGMPVIVYTFYHNLNSLCENAMIILARTENSKLYLFALETHRGSYYLCEYLDNRHINYGQADEDVSRQVADLLQQRDKNPNANFKHKNVNYSFDKGGNMSKTGDWGDKLIVVLHSDGKRRHLKWCDHYRDGGGCDHLLTKCLGSAHCEHYKNKFEDNSDVFYPKTKDEGKGGIDTPKSGFVWREHFRQASYGDKLLHKTVLVKSSPHTFKICEVTDEDFGFFKVAYDSKEHKYSKRVAYRNCSVYIFTGLDEAESEEV